MNLELLVVLVSLHTYYALFGQFFLKKGNGGRTSFARAGLVSVLYSPRPCKTLPFGGYLELFQYMFYVTILLDMVTCKYIPMFVGLIGPVFGNLIAWIYISIVSCNICSNETSKDMLKDCMLDHPGKWKEYTDG